MLESAVSVEMSSGSGIAARVTGSILGALGAGATLWLVYAVFDPLALTDAQAVLLFVPVVPVGAIAGYAIGSVFNRKEKDKTAAVQSLIRGGVVSLLIALFFVWMGSTDIADFPRRLVSPWCALPALIGMVQLGLGFTLRVARGPGSK